MTLKILETLPPAMHGRECHIWRIPLTAPEDTFPHSTKYLSDDEKRRADKFLLPPPRRQFVLVRSALRALLGAYLGIPPGKIPFVFNLFGKPCLPPPFAEWSFNVSHSGQQGLIAITRAGDVGVDIEQRKALQDLAGLANMIFSPEDMRVWEALPHAEQTTAFYRAWTRKEALAKALGYGLSADLRALHVSFCDSKEARVLDIDPALGPAHLWHLTPVDDEAGYDGALAVRGRDIEISCCVFDRQTFPKHEG